MKLWRVVSSVLFSIGLASFGFAVGGGISAEFAKRSGSVGLQGATTVAAWALIGTIVGFVIAIFLAFRLESSSLFRLTFIALLIGFAALSFFLGR